MEYNNTTVNSRKNKHLNDFERGQIQLLHNKGYSAYKIAKELRKASNTISNEMTFQTLIQTEGLPIEFLCMERTSSIWMIFKRSTEKTCHVTDVSQVKKDYPKNRRGTLVHFLDISLQT